MTFSVLIRDESTGEIGCGVTSRFLAVGALVLHARAGLGAVATQALTNVSFGARGLDMLGLGIPAEDTVRLLTGADAHPDRRQVAVLGQQGPGAAHTGTSCQEWAGHVTGDMFTCQGNVLASAGVLEAMAPVAAAHSPGQPVAATVLAVLEAGEAAGGDRRGRQSAALLVVRRDGGYGGSTDRVADLRTDDHPNPLAELRRLLELHGEIFSRPAKSDLMPMSGVTLATVAGLLASATTEEFNQQDAAAVWAVLERWAGRENLEERLVKVNAVDEVLLRALRRQAQHPFL